MACTLGHKTRTKEALKKLLQSGMNIARLNMAFFDPQDQQEIVENIREASNEVEKQCAIMVDLRGPLIRTLAFDSGEHSIKVKAGDIVRISTNQTLKGNQQMIAIDYPDIYQKLQIGDKIIIDYGGVVLTVVGFEEEDNYFA